MEKRWQCIKETTPCLSRMRSSGGASGHQNGVYVDMNKVEVILKVGRCGVESETEGPGCRVRQRGGGG